MKMNSKKKLDQKKDREYERELKKTKLIDKLLKIRRKTLEDNYKADFEAMDKVEKIWAEAKKEIEELDTKI